MDILFVFEDKVMVLLNYFLWEFISAIVKISFHAVFK